LAPIQGPYESLDSGLPAWYFLPLCMVRMMTSRVLQIDVLGFLAIAAITVGSAAAQNNTARHLPPTAFSQSLTVEGSDLQVDFAEGTFELSRDEILRRIAASAHAVALYYGHFPVSRALLLVMPVPGAHGVLQGTTWGDRNGFPAFLRLRIGEGTTHNELANDWIITHELVHTALPSLPDDQHWLEEGLASYVEPIARVQAGQLAVTKIWADMISGMPHGEPQPQDQGLDVTHTWGRTYWGGSLFCLMADIEIRKQTGNRRGLQDALRAIVASGGSIDKEWPLARILSTGDQATQTHVLEQMYVQWSTTPVSVDLPQLWSQLGIRTTEQGIVFDSSAPLAGIRTAITAIPSEPAIH
jgi:hypothetical protein